jgi:isopenicillin N synthase-like dioxygenase
MQTIHSACVAHGFFYVTNHGIAPSTVDALFRQSRALFALPLPAKLQLLVDRNNRGFSPMTKDKPATLTDGAIKQPNAQPVSKESFFLGREVSDGSEEAGDYMQGPNQWPSEALLPGFKADVSAYFEQAWRLSEGITRLLLQSLDCDTVVLDQPGAIDRPMLLLRMLHYNATRSEPEKGIYAASPHTDYGIITILANDDVGGLQIAVDKEGGEEWVNVAPMPGALLVNLGDMLQKWTNGYYRSTRHRVLNLSGRDRYSVPFFFEPNVNCVIRGLLEKEGEGGEVDFGEHLRRKHEEAQSSQL